MNDGLAVGLEGTIAIAQLVLAAVIASNVAGRRWRWWLAGIFFANGSHVLVFALLHAFGPVPDAIWALQVLDEAVFVAFVGFALSFPNDPYGRRWIAPASALALSAALALTLLLAGAEALFPRTAEHPLTAPRLLLGYGLPALAWGLLLGRMAWCWRHIPAEDRRAFQWLFAALAMRAANILTVTLPVFQQGDKALVYLANVANWAALGCVIAALAALVRCLFTEREAARRQTAIVLGLLLAGFLEALAALQAGGVGAFFTNMLLHFDVLVVRPLLAFVAIAVYPLLGLQRWAGLMAVGAAVLAGTAAASRPLLHSMGSAVLNDVASLGVGTVFAGVAVAVAHVMITAKPLDPKLPTWFPGQLVMGRYRITAYLGEGGIGEAYVALLGSERVVLKRTKTLDNLQRQALLAEAAALGQLNHPKIVGFHAVELDGDEPVLVMAYMGGGSLQGRLARADLPWEDAVQIAIDVLDAVQATHDARLLHGDIKPANILFDDLGRARLADFGASRPGPPDSSSDPSGTRRYMSPEQANGLVVDWRSDLYSLAIVLKEMLDAGVEQNLDRKGLERGRGAAHKRIPGALQGILRQALQPAPSRRFQSARTFRQALLHVQRQAGIKSSVAEHQQRTAYSNQVPMYQRARSALGQTFPVDRSLVARSEIAQRERLALARHLGMPH